MKQPEMEKQPEIDQPPEKHRAEREQNKPTHERPAEKPTGIVQPMIDELRYPKDIVDPPKASLPNPPGPPEQPAELDQDAGGGYNPDGTFPQT